MTENTSPPRSAKPAAAGAGAAPRRVIHFVTGGFSGATQVALDLCRAGQADGRMQVLLALRKKRSTDAARVEAIRAQGIEVEVLPGWAHLATIFALWRLCKRWQPQVLVAHGFPEHLLGRWAGWLAGVPRLLQVEHNTRERYTPWRRLQARWLAGRTEAMIGVSEGVRRRLVELGMPEAKTLAIPNGIELARFAEAALLPMAQREPQLVMVARFARQKDPLTLIRAVALLRERGLRVPLKFAGAGARSHLKVAQREVERLGLQEQVEFLGQYREVPALLMRSRVFVLSTRWEGMPLALVEAMAAGCACVVSAAPGTEDVLEPGVSGLVVPAGQAAAMADAIEQLMRDTPMAERLGRAARQRAIECFDARLMLSRYVALIDCAPARRSQ